MNTRKLECIILLIFFIILTSVVCIDLKNKKEAKNILNPNYKLLKFIVTAYCPCEECCGINSPGITASGMPAKYPLVAAPKEIDFTTQLMIPGYANNKKVMVLDRGGAVKNNKLDVLFPTHQEALEWGVQILDVEIYNE